MHSNFLPMQKFFEITTNTNDHNGNMSFRRLKLVACCHFASHFKTKYHDDYDCYMLDRTQCEGSMNYIFEKCINLALVSSQIMFQKNSTNVKNY